MSSSPKRSDLRRIASNHINSCRIPDDQDNHNPNSLTPNISQSEELTLADDHRLQKDIEKTTGLRKRRTEDLPAEERSWPDDIVVFDSKDDPQDPKNWSFRRKVVVTMLVGMTTMCSTFASSVFSAGFKHISHDFGVSTEVVTLGISLFIIGFVPGPIVFAPLSEMYGRRLPVLIPMVIFICFSVGTATAKDLQTIFITRFFGGVMASAPVTTVTGNLADMFEQKERGTAVVFYSLAVVAGPTLGPIIGGAVSQSALGWRWTEYLSVILTSVIVILDVFLLPETYAPVILTEKARRLRLQTGRWALHSRMEMHDFTFKAFMEKNLLRPLSMLVFEPMILALTLYNSFAYGILYLLFSAVPIIFEEQRGWNGLVGALPFLGVLLGTFVAAAINIWYSKAIFGPHVEKHGGRAEPEKRLPPMMLGSFTFPIGFFLLGWTSDPSIHWLPSVLGLVLIGMSFLLIFQAGINYLIDGYTKYSASAVAANTFMRSFLAAALPLVVQPLFRNLGINWACTLLGCVSIVLAGVPFVFYVFGRRLRGMSRSAIDDI